MVLCCVNAVGRKRQKKNRPLGGADDRSPRRATASCHGRAARGENSHRVVGGGVAVGNDALGKLAHVIEYLGGLLAFDVERKSPHEVVAPDVGRAAQLALHDLLPVTVVMTTVGEGAHEGRRRVDGEDVVGGVEETQDEE